MEDDDNPRTPSNQGPGDDDPRPPRTPIAARSAGPPLKLARPCCLRCSKHFDDRFRRKALRCNYKRTRKCAYCQDIHQPCEQIPEKYIKTVNGLRVLARRVQNNDDPDGTLGATLTRRSERYVKTVEAHLRLAGRFGGHRKPKNEVEVGILALGVNTRIARGIEGLLDVVRSEVGLPSIYVPSTDDDTSVDHDSSDSDDDAQHPPSPQDLEDENPDDPEEPEDEENEDVVPTPRKRRAAQKPAAKKANKPKNPPKPKSTKIPKEKARTRRAAPRSKPVITASDDESPAPRHKTTKTKRGEPASSASPPRVSPAKQSITKASSKKEVARAPPSGGTSLVKSLFSKTRSSVANRALPSGAPSAFALNRNPVGLSPTQPDYRMSGALPASGRRSTTAPPPLLNDVTPSKTARKRKHEADISERMASERETKRRTDAQERKDRKRVYKGMFGGTVRDYHEGAGGKLYWKVPTILPDGSSRMRNGLDNDTTTAFSTSASGSEALGYGDDEDELIE